MSSEDTSPLEEKVTGYGMRRPYKGLTGSVITFIFAVLLIGSFVSWYFFGSLFGSGGDEAEKSGQNQTQNEESDKRMPGNDYEEGTGQSALYNFFYHVFGGIEDGIEDSPHNLKNVEHIDDMNIEKPFDSQDTTGSGNDGNNKPLVAGTSSGNSNNQSQNSQNNQNNQNQNQSQNSQNQSGQSQSNQDQNSQSQTSGSRQSGGSSQSENNRGTTGAKPDDQYSHSVYDIVGSPVYSNLGSKTGTIHDILVNRDTGKAKAIVINEQSGRYERELSAIAFSREAGAQKGEGEDAEFTVAREKIKDAPHFTYGAIKDDPQFVSLRLLREGQVLDFEGKPAGQVDAIIYESAEAQNIYFTLRPVLAQQGPSKYFLPFKEANIIQSQNGYDIRLTQEQTETVAKVLFQGQGGVPQGSTAQSGSSQ